MVHFIKQKKRLLPAIVTQKRHIICIQGSIFGCLTSSENVSPQYLQIEEYGILFKINLIIMFGVKNIF